MKCKIINGLNKVLVKDIESNKAIALLVEERAKFEGWLKVQVIQGLISIGVDKKQIIPERNNRVDVTFTHRDLSYAIELKTVSTSYFYDDARRNDGRMNNIDYLFYDAEKLKNLDYDKKLLLFVVYPFDRNNKRHNLEWQLHRNRFKGIAKITYEHNIDFINGLKGVLYNCDIK